MNYTDQRPMGPKIKPGMQQTTPSYPQTMTPVVSTKPVPSATTGISPSPVAPPVPMTPVLGIGYTQGYLASKIGSKVRIEFLIGTNQLQDRVGVLLHVGISYVIIREEETDDMLLCDIYSIKFVTFYQ